MSPDPAELGRAVAARYFTYAPELFAELIRSAPWQAAAVVDRTHAEREWRAFALYACVRGLVAGAGFSRETADAIDAMHAAVLEQDDSALSPEEDPRRGLIADRHGEYGAIGQAGGKGGSSTLVLRLGEAAAQHMTGGAVNPELAQLIGDLHEALAEAVAELAAQPTDNPG
jgi:hypothetical protein